MTFANFTPTQWDTAQDKAAFARQFVRFVQSDFAAKHFTDKFYRRLSNTFGVSVRRNTLGAAHARQGPRPCRQAKGVP